MIANLPELSISEVSLYLPESATITKKEKMTDVDSFFEFELKDHPLGHKPGQFVEVSIPGIGEAPISISSAPTNDNRFEMVIRNVGTLTAALHSLEVGDTVGIRGPYGTSFPMENLKGSNLLFITGGIGLVPARSAIQYALNNREDYNELSILFGCKDPTQRLFTNEIEEWKKRDDIFFDETVDNAEGSNWKGKTGVITNLLIDNDINERDTYAFIVGPPVMYKFVIMNLKDMEFLDNRIIVSLERRMKCGVGKCGHCQMDSIYVCQDGPVFYLNEINHLSRAI